VHGLAGIQHSANGASLALGNKHRIQTKMLNRFPTARFFFKAGYSAWLILWSVAVVPVVIDALWKTLHDLNVWRLPFYDLTCYILGGIGLLCFVLALVAIICRKPNLRKLET